jgi:hypothetical protein
VSASGAGLQARLLGALHQAETLAGTGARVTYCLEHAAAVHAVDRGTLAAAWLLKIIECERARAAVASLKAGDADAEAGGR